MNNNKLLEMITYVSENKKHAKEMAYLHISMKDGNAAPSTGEIEQVLHFNFGRENGKVYKFDDKNLVIMLASNQGHRALALFDKAIYENFGRDSIQVTTNTLAESGIELLAGLIECIIPAYDVQSKSALRRMRRMSNCILVLDDDPMILKTMENVLRGFGSVHLAQDLDSFTSLYREYVPNVVFVDIHLNKYKGPHVVKKIREEIDPNIYAIMISSDSSLSTVLQVREFGAKGFIVKPLNRDRVYKHLQLAPTFIPKTS